MYHYSNYENNNKYLKKSHEKIADFIYNLSGGKFIKSLFITLVSIISISYLIPDLLIANMPINITTYVLSNIFLLVPSFTILNHVLLKFPSEIHKNKYLSKGLHGFCVFIISLSMNYKFTRIYIAQKCAEDNLQCNYTQEIILEPFATAIASTMISFVILYFAQLLFEILRVFTKVNGRLNYMAENAIKNMKYSTYFKYGVVFNIISTLVHFYVLSYLNSKLKVEPISY